MGGGGGIFSGTSPEEYKKKIKQHKMRLLKHQFPEKLMKL